jgi:hypothetical protein
MNYDKKKVVDKITKALTKSDEYNDELAKDIAFHMTDWLEDMSELANFYSAPDTYSSEQIEKLLLKYIFHVPNHLAAAHKLLTSEPLTDVFGVAPFE